MRSSSIHFTHVHCFFPPFMILGWIVSKFAAVCFPEHNNHTRMLSANVCSGLNMYVCVDLRPSPQEPHFAQLNGIALGKMCVHCAHDWGTRWRHNLTDIKSSHAVKEFFLNHAHNFKTHTRHGLPLLTVSPPPNRGVQKRSAKAFPVRGTWSNDVGPMFVYGIVNSTH